MRGRVWNPPLRIEIFDVNGRMVFGKGDKDLGLGSSPHTTRTFGSGEGFSPYALYPNPSAVLGSVREFIWQPDKSLGSGIYLIRLENGGNELIKRVVYLK
ncbi:hypothetical protein DRQ36_02925 [bacterium]|nr:MAG: hypothetical protein DRQ36_02925 [bacterium]